MLRLTFVMLWFVAMLAVPARADQIYLYDRPGFVGGDFESTGINSDLSGHPVASRAMSLRARTGSWLLCSEPNFQGNCLWISHAQISNLTPWGFAGGIRSIRAYNGSGPRFRWPTAMRLNEGDLERHSLVIAEDNYSGAYRKLTGDTPDLAAAGIAFPVGAFVITGRPAPRAWLLCTAPNYAGRCLTAVNSMEVMAEYFTDRIASIRQLPLHAASTDPPLSIRHR